MKDLSTIKRTIIRYISFYIYHLDVFFSSMKVLVIRILIHLISLYNSLAAPLHFTFQHDFLFLSMLSKERELFSLRSKLQPFLDFFLQNVYLQWDTISFSVNNGRYESQVNIIALVPLDGAIVGDDFLFDNNDWYISGNKEMSEKAKHESYSLDKYLNHYIYSTDNKINVNSYVNYDPNDEFRRNRNNNDNSIDHSLWYFQAPFKYLGNIGISYKGYLKFTLGSFSGNFSQINGRNVRTKKVLFFIVNVFGQLDRTLNSSYLKFLHDIYEIKIISSILSIPFVIPSQTLELALHFLGYFVINIMSYQIFMNSSIVFLHYFSQYLPHPQTNLLSYFCKYLSSFSSEFIALFVSSFVFLFSSFFFFSFFIFFNFSHFFFQFPLHVLILFPPFSCF